MPREAGDAAGPWRRPLSYLSPTFDLRLAWDGDTGAPTYTRDLTASAEGKVSLPMSSAAAYGGDDLRWNPEDTFGTALATCHTLTFLSLASKFRLSVKHVDVAVTVTLDTVERVTKITKIQLRPTITVAPGTSADKVAEAWEKAHKYCFVANSITSEVELPRPELREA
jgi:organic hydroperoxide reductase OsmC/OhrA